MKLTNLVLAGAMALGLAGCNSCEKEKEYRLEMGLGYTCQADFHEKQDHVWVTWGEQTIGLKTICRCTGDDCMPALSYAVNVSEEDNDVLEVINENGAPTTDSSWYKDLKVKNIYKQKYSLVKQCEQLLEQKYKKDF